MLANHRTVSVWVTGACVMAFAVPSFAGGSNCEGKRRGRPHRNPLGVFALLDLLASDQAPLNFTVEAFPDADSDGDGQLGNEEWVAYALDKTQSVLDRLLDHRPEADTDGDGQVSDAELEALKVEVMAAAKDRVLDRHPDADTDGDGAISDAEWEAFEAAKFAALLERKPEADIDGDGTVTADELAAIKLARMEQRSEGGDGFGGKGHRRGFRKGSFGQGRSGKGGGDQG